MFLELSLEQEERIKKMLKDPEIKEDTEIVKKRINEIL